MMYRIGIDVGSTYTKYCVMDEDNHIIELTAEKTPVRQEVYFQQQLDLYRKRYPEAVVTACGYGRANVDSVRQVNELAALAKGVFLVSPESRVVLDIGGQDTKIICQEAGTLKQFFLNDKCAAGCGMFLSNVCHMLDVRPENISLPMEEEFPIHLSSVCAVFAQSEIVELIAANTPESEIIAAVLRQILTQAKPLLAKVDTDSVFLSGGMVNIKNIDVYAEHILGRKCTMDEKGQFLAAIGFAVVGFKLKNKNGREGRCR